VAHLQKLRSGRLGGLVKIILLNASIFVSISAIMLSTCRIASAQSNDLPCNVIMRFGYDPYQGVTVWPKMPQSEMAPDDALVHEKENILIRYPSLLWRYINNLKPDAPIEPSLYTHLYIKSVERVEKLEGRPSYYVPSSELFHISIDVNTPAKLDRVASTYLSGRSKDEDVIFVSHKVWTKLKDITIAKVYLSPLVAKGSRTRTLSPLKFFMAYLDVFTGLKIEQNWFLARKFKQEIDDGCLNGQLADCSILNVARKLYSVERKLTSIANTNVDVIKLVCDA
jgi:hypothetical protein